MKRAYRLPVVGTLVALATIGLLLSLGVVDGENVGCGGVHDDTPDVADLVEISEDALQVCGVYSDGSAWCMRRSTSNQDMADKLPATVRRSRGRPVP